MDRFVKLAIIMAGIAGVFGVFVSILQWQFPQDTPGVPDRRTLSVPSSGSETNKQKPSPGPVSSESATSSSKSERHGADLPQTMPAPRESVDPSPSTEGEATPDSTIQRSERYINETGIGESPQIFVVDASQNVDFATAGQIAKHLNGRTDLFRQSFIKDGLFDQVLAGESDILADLGLDRQRGLIVLIRKRTSEARATGVSPDLQKVEVALMSRQLDPTKNFYSTVSSTTGIGAGFSEDIAQNRALSQAIEQLLAEARRGILSAERP